MNIMNRKYHKESGNALWFIMLAIAMLAALTITITRSSDSVEQSGDFERHRIQASNIMRYSKGLAQTIDTMRMRGISENDISFHSPDWGHTDYEHSPPQGNENRIFSVEGGGMNLPDINGATNWSFFGNRAVQDVETAANDLIIQTEVSKNVCLQINMLADVTNTGGEPPTDDIDAPDPYIGSFSATAGTDVIIGNDAAELAGKPTGCREDGGSYYFYHVLIER